MVDSRETRVPWISDRRFLSAFTLVLVLLVVPAVAAMPLQDDQQPPIEQPQVDETAVVEQDDREETTLEADEPSEGVTIRIDEQEETGRRRRSVDKDTQVHVGSDLVVRADEVARDAIVFSGSLTVEGKVIGDVVCILGDVEINGEVTGEVVAVGGDVELGPNAEVMGDVTSVGGSVYRDEESRILGSINQISIGPGVVWPDLSHLWRWQGPHMWDMWEVGLQWNVFWTLFKWAMLVLLVSFVFLLAREPVERTGRQISGEFWKSLLLGLVAVVFLPFLFVMVILVLIITIIGIPLLIVVIPLAVVLLLFALLLGYTAAAYSAGGWLSRRFGWSTTSPYLALLIGVVAIQALSLIGQMLGAIGGLVWFFAMMFGLVGWVVRFGAWTAGLGAALLTQLGRREPAFLMRPTPPASAPSYTAPATTPEPSEDHPQPAASADDGSSDRDDG
jgi:cytoskeletal protein CcmA (bactofilin family)